MLEYFKTILSKVSFDQTLFEKELKKAINSLINKEIALLKDWCFQTFGSQHQPILRACFSGY
ncbi:MAG: hypothetical protein AAF551_04990 [Bacteroidota bacterium]